jgi:intraflagellar transport protein 88
MYFNLANAFFHNKMYDEALSTYSFIIKNKQFPQSGRLRVNMGNIYYAQTKYTNAIKMYRMAIDQLSSTAKELTYKIYKNMGNAFVKLGQFSDAIEAYKNIPDSNIDVATGYNLVLCYYAHGDKERMKEYFLRLLSIPIPVQRFAYDAQAIHKCER